MTYVILIATSDFDSSFMLPTCFPHSPPRSPTKIADLYDHTLRFTFKNKEIMVPLFKSLARRILKFGNVVWAPCLRKNITCIENVQRLFTKHITGV